MRQYKVKYLDKSGEIVRITVTAPSMAAVEEYFGRDNIIEIRVPESKVIIGHGN